MGLTGIFNNLQNSEPGSFRKLPIFNNRYELLEIISNSFKTEVYKAYDRKKDKFVAIKIIRFDAPAVLLNRKEFIQRWQRMCKYTGKLRHPNILTVIDNGIYREYNIVFYTTNYIAGFSLAEAEHLHSIPLEARLKLSIDITEALAYAHKKGIIHRDLKPGNILVDYDWKGYITDFQSARFEANPITRRGMTLGTPAYMSPEQIEGKELDSRSDIFSLGNLIYFIFAERPLFSGKNSFEISESIVMREPALLLDKWGDISTGLNELISGMLKKDPSRRIQDADKIAGGLREILANRRI